MSALTWIQRLERTSSTWNSHSVVNSIYDEHPAATPPSDGSSPISKVPAEVILYELLPKFSSIDDVFAMSKVNKTFHSVCWDPKMKVRLWEDIENMVHNQVLMDETPSRPTSALLNIHPILPLLVVCPVLRAYAQGGPAYYPPDVQGRVRRVQQATVVAGTAEEKQWFAVSMINTFARRNNLELINFANQNLWPKMSLTEFKDFAVKAKRTPRAGIDQYILVNDYERRDDIRIPLSEESKALVFEELFNCDVETWPAETPAGIKRFMNWLGRDWSENMGICTWNDGPVRVPHLYPTNFLIFGGGELAKVREGHWWHKGWHRRAARVWYHHRKLVWETRDKPRLDRVKEDLDKKYRKLKGKLHDLFWLL